MSNYDQPPVAWALTSTQATQLGMRLIEAARSAGLDGTIMLNNGADPNEGGLYVDAFNVTHGFVNNDWVGGVEVMDPSHL